MAPGADVRYYGAKSCEDPDIADTLDSVVDENQVSIVSNSYGEPESVEALSDVVANEQASSRAPEGIDVLLLLRRQR